MNLEFELRWIFTRDGESEALEALVFDLLRAVRDGGNLNYAAKSTGVSYRHAWGLIRAWETRLGQPLLSSRQGRGARLTKFAESLLAIAADTRATLDPTLATAALEAAARLSEAGDQRHQALTIVSSHSERMLLLRDALKARQPVTLDITGSENALNRYRRGDADVAGFHLPLGDLGRTVAAALIALLDPKRDQLWLLEQRTLGLLSRPPQPVRQLPALADGKLRFVNRQPGSGTRLIFDGLLGAAGIAPGTINGYDNEEYSHTAVAALVASNHADVAFAAADVAHDMALAFEALVDERFYLVINRSADSGLRRALTTFCKDHHNVSDGVLKADEYAPTVAVLKRVHRAGFWKAQVR